MYTQQFVNSFYYIIIIEGAIITFQAVYNETATTGSLKIIPLLATFIVFTVIQARITKKLKTPKVRLLTFIRY
jgi:hypothetical protein